MNRITNKQIRFDVISILGNKIQHVAECVWCIAIKHKGELSR